MSATESKMPLIENDRGVAVRFERSWLRAALDRAACDAGHEDWVLLDEFSTAISEYLRRLDGEDVIIVTELERVVRATLRDIGFREIAVKFRAVNPFQSVSLSALLHSPKSCRGAAFFKRLAGRIEALRVAKVRFVEFHDLQACVQELCGDDSLGWWDRPLMTARVVDLIRDQIGRKSWPGPVSFAVR